MDGSTYTLNDPLSQAAGGLTPDLLGAPLGENTYAWGAGQRIQLFPPETSVLTIDWLESVHRYLYDAGLPVAEIIERIRLPHHVGLVYDRLSGPTLHQLVLDAPGVTEAELARLARIFAQTQRRIHNLRFVPAVPVAPRLFGPIIERLRLLPPCLRQRLVARLMTLSRMPFVVAGIPLGYRSCLCHGDYGPNHVILTPRGPIATDWAHCHLGDPLEDVARSVLLLQGLFLELPDLPEEGLDVFLDCYVDHYVELFSTQYDLDPDLARQRIDDWRPIVCALRLNDSQPELQEWLVNEIGRTL